MSTSGVNSPAARQKILRVIGYHSSAIIMSPFNYYDYTQDCSLYLDIAHSLELLVITRTVMNVSL